MVVPGRRFQVREVREGLVNCRCIMCISESQKSGKYVKMCMC